MATISRLLQIIRLFWKRALLKRQYSAKETYNFKEPTNRSHPIVWCMYIYVCLHALSLSVSFTTDTIANYRRLRLCAREFAVYYVHTRTHTQATQIHKINAGHDSRIEISVLQYKRERKKKKEKKRKEQTFESLPYTRAFLFFVCAFARV